MIYDLNEEGWSYQDSLSYYGHLETPCTIIQEALNAGVEVYVLDDTSHTPVDGADGFYLSDYHVEDTLANMGITSPNLHSILINSDQDVIPRITWIRDWGPFNVYKDDVDSLYLLGRYYNSFLADYFQVPFVEQSESMMDGGNYLTDGHNRVFIDGHREVEINQEDFGLTDVIQVTEWRSHIDYCMKLINEETVFLADIPESDYANERIEETIATLNEHNSCFGRSFKFVQI